MNNKIAIIDIGSNSVRLLLAEIGEGNSIRIINELKEYVRLGDGLDKNDMLSKEKIELGIKTLSTYKNICDSFKISEITAVATEAVRRAKNRDDFLMRAKNELNLEITVLSGKEEAYYDYFSVINTINIKDALIMDIGGASTEIMLVKNRKLIESISFPFGAITLTEHFNIDDVLNENTEKKLISFLKENLNTLDWLKSSQELPLIGIGGSIRTAAKIHKKSISYPLNLIHNYELQSSDVKKIYDTVKSKNSKERKKIKGLSSDRADIFVGAAALLCTILDLCSIRNIIISRNGIREGLLYSHICKDKKPIDNILSFSINSLLINQNCNIKHSKHIYHLFKSFCRELSPLINSKINLSNIIEASAMLHDIGSNITYYFHHKHSLYIILNSQIYGLTHRELVISACIAANHRNSNLAIDFEKYKMIINKYDIEIIKKLGILLRLSESLDASMTFKVKDIECTIDEKNVITKTFLKDTDSCIELREANSCLNDFENIFHKKLYIV